MYCFDVGDDRVACFFNVAIRNGGDRFVKRDVIEVHAKWGDLG